MWIRRATRPLLVAAVLLAGAGCAIVPTSGSPRVWGEDTGRDTISQPYVRIIPESPPKDAAPIDIVKGFLAAAASFDDPTLAVAKQYLTPEAAVKWKPYGMTQVYEGRLSESDAKADAKSTLVKLTYASQAAIDSEGRRTAQVRPDIDEMFELTKIGGQWRISNPPDGRWLSSDDIKRAYREMDLYYPPATNVAGLVLDRVWEPIDPSTGIAETRVRRLLSGPTKTIRPAVATAFPQSTRLNRISVEGNTVVIDFNSGLLEVRSDQMNALKAQLAWTLGDLVAGRLIEVRVNGEPFRGGLTFKPSELSSYDPNVLSGSPTAFYMQGNVLHRAADKGPGSPVLGAAGTTTMPFSDPAISWQSQKVAARAGGNGIWVADLSANSQWQQWIKANKVTPPSWDRYGAVWTAHVTDTETQVLSADGLNSPHRIMIPPELTHADIRALRVSRDGARVAMIIMDGAGAHVTIGTIVRSGSTAAIQELQTLVPAKNGYTISAIAWQDASTLLVLSKAKRGQELAPWSIMEGSATSSQTIRLDLKSDIASIVGVPDRILASTVPYQENPGEILLYDDTKAAWSRLVGDAASAPVYPLG